MVAMNIDNLFDIRELIELQMNKYDIDCDVLTYTLETINKNLIVIEETNNNLNLSTTRREQTVSNISFEINIYCPQDKIISNTIINEETEEEEVIHETIPKMEQARLISQKIDEVLSLKLGFNRSLCRPTPNLDKTIYRITMRYDTKFFDNKNMFF